MDSRFYMNIETLRGILTTESFEFLPTHIPWIPKALKTCTENDVRNKLSLVTFPWIWPPSWVWRDQLKNNCEIWCVVCWCWRSTASRHSIQWRVGLPFRTIVVWGQCTLYTTHAHDTSPPALLTLHKLIARADVMLWVLWLGFWAAQLLLQSFDEVPLVIMPLVSWQYPR